MPIVLGDPTIGVPTGSTELFEFPAHGPNFQKTMVYINSEKETWRLCRYPPCSACPESPEAFLFHVDCFWLAKRNSPKLTLSYIWLVGLWSRLGVGLYHSTQPLWVFPALAAHMSSWKDTMKWLERLSPELCQMVTSYCPESPLWRYSIAVTWPPQIFSRLEESEPVTLSLSNLSDWTRGSIASIAGRSRLADHRIVRMSLDGDGIQKIEFLSSWPEASPSCFPVQGTWYIIESLDQLADIQFQSRVKELSLDSCSR